MRKPIPPILLLGPTAGGKSALAIELAQRIQGGGECISADSMQVYRGMDIGTAKAPPHEWRGVPHHLIDIVEPNDDSFSVDRWLELCDEAVRGIRERGRTPIIVGGTNLYVQALLGGMSQALPAPDDALRARLNEMSRDDLRARLEEIDPLAAQRIHVNDRKRTIRAIEVFEQTGQRLSAMQGQWDDSRRPRIAMRRRHGETGKNCEVFIVGLDFPIEAINRRINARVKAMIEQGLVEEVRRVHETNALGRNAREALGYKQIIDHLEGRSTLEEAIEQIKIRTRRYAKQQRTWLRRFRTHQPSVWLDATDQSTQSLVEQALTAINGWLNEPAIVRIGDVSTGIDPDRCAS
jgi:tRNA dimethylallyltransferase